MSNLNIEVHFHYGDENFNELMEKIIMEKLLYYSFSEENKTCYNKDSCTAAICKQVNVIDKE